MRYKMAFHVVLFYVIALYTCYADDLYDGKYKWPTIGISILVRNKETSLPYFLTCLQKLDYPKDRLSIWIHSDYNEDETGDILDAWADNYSAMYKKVHLSVDHTTTGKQINDQTHQSEWTPNRYQHVIALREKALQQAKDSWADYILMLDADVFLTHPGTLKDLVKKNKPIVAPMLHTDGLYSNFWGGMTTDFYYKRSENYEELIRRKQVGCFDVPMVHTAVLISLRHENTAKLTYDPKKVEGYKGPKDDIITFALSAKINGINMTVCNDVIYGFVPIPVEDNVTSEADQVENVKLEALGRGVDLPTDPVMAKFIKNPPKNKFGLDEIFLINLERRPERKNLMLKSFDILGIDAHVVTAVDGQKLTIKELTDLSVTMMPGYEDPYHKRPMKAGEIGCFLSHYFIWRDIADRNLRTALILEDDIHFTSYFREHYDILLEELTGNGIDWDLVYIGRKVLQNEKETYVSDHITKPLYSYWTLGYLISERGARKLIQAEPLSKMLPVDEFLPIMFDQHPNATWKAHFKKRNLKAFSAAPLLVHPTHYTGDLGYVSDTEDSPLTGANTARTQFDQRYMYEL